MDTQLLKKKIYLVLSLLFLVALLSTASICNLGSNLAGNLSNEDNSVEFGQDENTVESTKKNLENKEGSSGNAESESDSSDSSSTDKGEPGNNNKDSKNSSGSGNNPPVINSMNLNGDDFLPNKQYLFTCDVTDPDNNVITYNWHVEAGGLDTSEAASITWTAPNDQGIYEITLSVSDGWGGTDSMKKTVSVGGVPKNASPVIQDIAVYPEGSVYTDNTYEIWCVKTDPNNSVINIEFKATGGILHDQDANIIMWDAPNTPGTYKVTVTVSDKEGNSVTDSKNITVEQSRIEITDIIVQIDYIEPKSSYYIKGVIIDPKSQISQYIWYTTGGNIIKQEGFTAVWETPPDPGVYSLTLGANTLGGITITKTKEFTVNLPNN